ncbi:heavy metal translocating P-type ATPase [Paenibacillus humicola]|uniref:heavy metal translocating P-type ATPase n=1 Tax=Paenibacillus humicola TaxID=3110540 RepID=UPI00237A5E9C|nr:heavy metal translocating P-type ATPase [Paenibacillus humicola]
MNVEGTAILDLHIQGMSCTACAVRIEKAVGKMPGVSGVSVHYAGRSANIRFSPENVAPSAIIERIGQLGFSAAPLGSDHGSEGEIASLKLRFFFSALLTLPLLWTMAHHYELLQGLPMPSLLQHPLLQFALAAIVQFGLGMPFYFGAYYAVRERTANMDVLVTVGTTAAFLYSYYAMLSGGALYFETSAVVITAVLLGKLLEASASGRVMRESAGFDALQAQEAVVIRSGVREQVPASQLRRGDRLVALPGKPIAADGIVEEGTAPVDESLVTGESMPTAKGPGDPVYAGTFVTAGELHIRAESIGADAMLGRMAALARAAQSTKSSIGRKVDRMAAVFVPVMLALSLGTMLLWLTALKPADIKAASVHALAVLLAACPCALGLAAPLSLVLASGKLLRRGIVLREAGALERLAQLDTLVLDKTGTLTEGRPVLTGMAAVDGKTNTLLRMAAAAEAGAAHPFAAVIGEAAAKAGIAAPAAGSFRSVPGRGVEAEVEGRRVEVGSAAFGAERGWAPGRVLEQFARRREEAGETVVYVALDGRCAGALAFADPVKRSARAAVARLADERIRVLMATGDHPAAAVHAGRQAGIAAVHAQMLPEQKEALIRSMQREGRVVGMAGDGWNDAPALAAADVGFAMGNGTEAALRAGHLTLIRSRLTGVCEAVLIGRLTVRNIRQNLAFAMLYNAVVIPFAALGGLEPWMAGTAMALSSVSVVGNALRLNRRLNRAILQSERLSV